MTNKQPPFEITNTILTLVSEISELVGRLSATDHLTSNPTLRRTNRIKTIYSSLAIEQNTLNLEQVTAILSGKRVIAPPKDIREVQNAYEIYEHINTLNPYSADDLLLAHSIMTCDLVKESGMFRTGATGVVDNKGNVLHIGTLPSYIHGLVHELMDWAKTSDIHMLVKSCVFHYELELIHPFADGNGRMGRLWHTLLLSKWSPMFAWLPVESIIHHRQAEYYAAINKSNVMGESTAFIEFMLSAIKEALTEAIGKPQSKSEERFAILSEYLQKNAIIKNSDVRDLLGVSSATANRILCGLTNEGKLNKIHIGRFWCYELTNKTTED